MGGLQPRRPWLLWGAGIGVAGLLAVGTLQARETAPVSATIAVAELPAEAQTVHAAIRAGGPFAYAKDGAVFGNIAPLRSRMNPPIEYSGTVDSIIASTAS